MKAGLDPKLTDLYWQQVESLALPFGCRAAIPQSGELVIESQCSTNVVTAAFRMTAGKYAGAMRVVCITRKPGEDWVLLTETRIPAPADTSLPTTRIHSEYEPSIERPSWTYGQGPAPAASDVIPGDVGIRDLSQRAAYVRLEKPAKSGQA